MKRINLKLAFVIGLAVLFCSSAGAQQDTTRVLFVGNSFTYFFNLSQVVSSMARTQDIVIETRQSTVGGSTLKQHWHSEKGTVTRAMIDKGNWDYVVFNNHSLATIDSPEEFMDYSTKFANLVREHGAEPVFMMTWAYKANPLMQTRITEMYQQLSIETNSDNVPCGLLFAEARQQRPELELFFDQKHPSSNGTYLLGLAFYKYFTGRSTLKIPSRLTTKDINGENLYLIFMLKEDADFLQQLVDEYDFKTLK